jgi:V/A-type H+-transporting ATPase subunit A
MLESVLKVIRAPMKFAEFEEVQKVYKQIINLYKQMNYAEYQSEKFKNFESQINEIVDRQL